LGALERVGGCHKKGANTTPLWKSVSPEEVASADVKGAGEKKEKRVGSLA